MTIISTIENLVDFWYVYFNSARWTDNNKNVDGGRVFEYEKSYLISCQQCEYLSIWVLDYSSQA